MKQYSQNYEPDQLYWSVGKEGGVHPSENSRILPQWIDRLCAAINCPASLLDWDSDVRSGCVELTVAS